MTIHYHVTFLDERSVEREQHVRQKKDKTELNE